jgi:hypothetical protein|tara:strand:+ start:9665 stop:9952 length:288 start_codon:yes stop_codon:yes gene_type:complete
MLLRVQLDTSIDVRPELLNINPAALKLETSQAEASTVVRLEQVRKALTMVVTILISQSEVSIVDKEVQLEKVEFMVVTILISQSEVFIVDKEVQL